MNRLFVVAFYICLIRFQVPAQRHDFFLIAFRLFIGFHVGSICFQNPMQRHSLALEWVSVVHCLLFYIGLKKGASGASAEASILPGLYFGGSLL